MSWFDRILRRRRNTGDEPAVPGPTPYEHWTVAGLTFDTTGWQLVEATPSRMAWSAPQATLALTRRDTPCDPPALTLTELRNTERQQARARGEDIVFVDVLTVRGVEVLRAAYKREKGTGYAYRGIVEVRGADACFRIESDIDEGNSTGTREAMVSAMRAQTGDLSFGPVRADGSRAILGYSYDPYNPAFDDDALLAVSDDERLDLVMLEHPIARTRVFLATVLSSLRVSPEVVPGRVLATPPQREEQMPLRRQLSNAVARGLYAAVERYDLVEASLQDEIAELGDTHTLQLATCLMQLGTFFHMRDRAGNALPLLSRAEKLFVERSGPRTRRTPHERGPTTASR